MEKFSSPKTSRILCRRNDLPDHAAGNKKLEIHQKNN